MAATLQLRFARLLLLTLIAGVAIVAPRSQAAGRVTSPDFTVTGLITELSSPSDYASPDVLQIDDSKVPLQLTSVRYFAVAGTWVKDHFEFPFHVLSAPGVRVGGMDLASNPRANTRLIEVGTVVSAPPAVSTPTSHSVLPASDGSSVATLNLRWHDPFNITVVQVYDQLGWSWSGNYISGYWYYFPPRIY